MQRIQAQAHRIKDTHFVTLNVVGTGISLGISNHESEEAAMANRDLLNSDKDLMKELFPEVLDELYMYG